jgi:hypothetical protein
VVIAAVVAPVVAPDMPAVIAAIIAAVIAPGPFGGEVARRRLEALGALDGPLPPFAAIIGRPAHRSLARLFPPLAAAATATAAASTPPPRATFAVVAGSFGRCVVAAARLVATDVLDAFLAAGPARRPVRGFAGRAGGVLHGTGRRPPRGE